MYAERIAVSVTELVEYVAEKLNTDPVLRDIRVTGEISGYKLHLASGHRYFILKDEKSSVRCVFFRQNAYGLDFDMKDGMRVTVTGRASIYTKDGSFQLYVDSVKREGEGKLFMQFERLKRMLDAEGLFRKEHKRELPYCPKTIGVATSRSGAALQDIIRVAKHRDPNVGIIIAHCSVQGKGAEDEIAAAIEALNRNGESEVILVGRGGGSMEDLWCFNEEKVARAIYNSKIPVISCVGHEVDFTIADFVADFRAATPSNAAEIAVPVAEELRYTVDMLFDRLARSLKSTLEIKQANLDRLIDSPALRNARENLIQRRLEKLVSLEEKMIAKHNVRMTYETGKLNELIRTLNATGPSAVLSRGYAVVKKDGKFIDSANKLNTNDNIKIIMGDGQRSAVITGDSNE